jgi:hypothetical protein
MISDAKNTAEIIQFTKVAGQAPGKGKPKKNLAASGIYSGGTKSKSQLLSNINNVLSCPAVNPHSGDAIASTVSSDFIAKIAALTDTQLRERYPAEASRHMNMLARRKSEGAVIHPDFIKFRSFLRIMGPIPTKGATLDRIDNEDREYAPGKVRWADKVTQNNNKSDTITLFDSRTGKTYTVSQLAKLLGIKPDTIRKNHYRGWTADEIIYGKKSEIKIIKGAGTFKNPDELVPRNQSGKDKRQGTVGERMEHGRVFKCYPDFVIHFVRNIWPEMRLRLVADDFDLEHPEIRSLIKAIDPAFVAFLPEYEEVYAQNDPERTLWHETLTGELAFPERSEAELQLIAEAQPEPKSYLDYIAKHDPDRGKKSFAEMCRREYTDEF